MVIFLVFSRTLIVFLPNLQFFCGGNLKYLIFFIINVPPPNLPFKIFIHCNVTHSNLILHFKFCILICDLSECHTLLTQSLFHYVFVEWKSSSTFSDFSLYHIIHVFSTPCLKSYSVQPKHTYSRVISRPSHLAQHISVVVRSQSSLSNVYRLEATRQWIPNPREQRNKQRQSLIHAAWLGGTQEEEGEREAVKKVLCLQTETHE